MNALPYGLERWLPAVHGRVDCAGVVDVGAPGASARLARLWERCGAGQIVVLAGDRGLPGRASRVARMARRLRGARHTRFLVLPGTGGGHVLLETAPRAGLVTGLDLLPAGRRRWRVLRRILRPLAALGLLERVGLPEVAIVERSGQHAARATHLTIAQGVPGRLRKTVVLESNSDGQRLRFVKIAATTDAREAVRNEARALHDLQERGFEEAPRLGALALDGDAPWFAQEPLDGERSPDVIGDEHVDFVRRLFTTQARALPLKRIPAFVEAEQQLAALAGRADPEWRAAYVALARGLLRHFRGRLLPCGTRHGDFTPWNLAVRDQRLLAFDWEFMSDDAPALHDLLHFHVQTGVLVRHADGPTLEREIDEFFGTVARGLLDELGVDSGDVAALLGLYILTIGVEDERSNLIERPPFPQVAWLRATRLALAVRLTARLDGDRTQKAVAA